MPLRILKTFTSLHIPSDANLTDENIRCSFADAHAFFTKFYPLYANVVMPVCTNSVSSACFFIKAIPTRLRKKGTGRADSASRSLFPILQT